jgi:GNAT superfamily N-acetyltransferase
MTATDLIIRDATEHDLQAIVDLLADDDLGATREDPSNLELYRAAFARIVNDPNQTLAVMTDGETVIGTLQLTLVPGLSHKGTTRALIEAVRIVSTARGGGLGTKLIGWAIQQAREGGAGMIQLSSNATREDAHRFYRKLGFEQSHVGFKMKVEPIAAEAADPWCDPETGICEVPGLRAAATPNLALLGRLTAEPKSNR